MPFAVSLLFLLSHLSCFLMAPCCLRNVLHNFTCIVRIALFKGCIFWGAFPIWFLFECERVYAGWAKAIFLLNFLFNERQKCSWCFHTTRLHPHRDYCIDIHVSVKRRQHLCFVFHLFFSFFLTMKAYCCEAKEMVFAYGTGFWLVCVSARERNDQIK